MSTIARSALISRREFLKLALLAGGGVLVACKKGSTSGLGTAVTSPTSPGAQAASPAPLGIPGSTETSIPTQASTATAEATQASTATGEATLPWQKIKNIIILIEENHSFDSLFANFPGANGHFAPNICAQKFTERIDDPRQYNQAYTCSYKESEIPNYWKIATSFTLCDNYFSEVRAPSCPNFLILGTAQSPIVDNPPTDWHCPDTCYDLPSLPNVLDAAGISWHDYGGNNAVIKSLQGRDEISINSLGDFFNDAQDGKLANVIWINTFLIGGKKTSGHPPSNICDAENYAVDILNAVMSSPQWPNTLLFIIWDEWGGFYDHVQPPVVEKLADGTPFRYGKRVPCIVISPYARANSVSHTQYSHVSILKTVETIFNLQPLNERDGNATTLLDCLDFTQDPIAPITISKRPCGR